MRQPTIHFAKGYKFATLQQLQEAYIERNQILVEGQIEIAKLQDKLHRRNMQIKELKRIIETNEAENNTEYKQLLEENQRLRALIEKDMKERISR